MSLTFTLFVEMIDTGTSNQDIVSDRKDALTTDPLAIPGSDPSIVENGCFVQLHTTVMDLVSKRHLVRMEVVEARSADDLIWMIAQDVANGLGSEENIRLRGLRGRFIHHDAESLPFEDASFDLVYSNGVLHHTPNTAVVVREIHRVLRPGGRAIVMLYAEDSLHYWRKLVWLFGLKEGLLDTVSMGEIMSRTVERSANDARPLVKVYTKRRAAGLFRDFDHVELSQRQLLAEELPAALRWTLPSTERRFGWNLIVKATKRV